MLMDSLWSNTKKNMPRSKETLVRLFYNVSSFSLIVLLFLYFSSIALLKFINFIGSYPIIQRNRNVYEHLFTDEEEVVEHEQEQEQDISNTYCYSRYTDIKDHGQHLVADIVHGGESIVFLSNNKNITRENHQNYSEHITTEDQYLVDGENQEHEITSTCDEQLSIQASIGSEPEYELCDDDDDDGEEIQPRDADTSYDSVSDFVGTPTQITNTIGEKLVNQERGKNNVVGKKDFTRDEKFIIFAPTQLESKKIQVEEEEIYGDSCTVGSTSKSSSEWRSSIKDSGTEDPFSSSSRRSCPRWESYTVFQKYDEEMMFLDRISAQKLHETESLKSIQVCPRSISDRIVHKFTTINKKPTDIRENPYHELEAAYVAQICLTWEALNWNYNNFQCKRALNRDLDTGCAATVAQQFQQFQVLLQRYVENEPYEQGRRPEVYARMRLLAPKLLLVPEYRDSEDDRKEDDFGSRISSAAFLMIMEDGIRTFMDFLKADKERPCQIISSFFKRIKRGSVDPALLHLMKKVNNKKKMKLKDFRRAGKCIRRRKLKVEEEMEILMGLIDLKVVSRVLRMKDLSEQQLHWCEEKMSKVKILDGKLKRDSTPLFFPAH